MKAEAYGIDERGRIHPIKIDETGRILLAEADMEKIAKMVCDRLQRIALVELETKLRNNE